MKVETLPDLIFGDNFLGRYSFFFWNNFILSKKVLNFMRFGLEYLLVFFDTMKYKIERSMTLSFIWGGIAQGHEEANIIKITKLKVKDIFNFFMPFLLTCAAPNLQMHFTYCVLTFTFKLILMSNIFLYRMSNIIIRLIFLNLNMSRIVSTF